MTSDGAAGCPAVRFTELTYRSAVYRIRSDRPRLLAAEIRRQRDILEGYVRRDRQFLHSYSPVAVAPDAPIIAKRMASAAEVVGVGPMAAVAGTVAQLACEAARAAGARHAVVDNGGDVFMAAADGGQAATVTIALFAGTTSLGSQLALNVTSEHMPLAVCSSSATMGHSASLGACDLATVVSRDAALADAAATDACNRIRKADDISGALERILSYEGVDGVLVVIGDQVGVAGRLPPLVRNVDGRVTDKIAHHPRSIVPAAVAANLLS